MKKHLRYIFGAAGCIIFVVLLFKIGPSNIASHVKKIGWWLAPALALPVLWYVSYTFAWLQFLRPLRKKMPFMELFRVKIIGEALNTLTPMNFIAGDPARAYLLRHRLLLTEGTASVVVDRTLHMMSTLMVIFVGTVSAFVELKFLPKNIKYGLPIVLCIASLFIIYIFIHQHKGLFSFAAEIAQRLRLKKSFSEKTLENIAAIDIHIQDFYKKNRRGFWIALSCHVFGRILGIIEIFIIGHAANHHFSLKIALLLGAAAPIINFTFAFIPGSLGIMESAYSAILYFLHFSPAVGLTIQIVRRLRAAIWILLGFIFLGFHGRKKLGPQPSSLNISR